MTTLHQLHGSRVRSRNTGNTSSCAGGADDHLAFGSVQHAARGRVRMQLFESARPEQSDRRSFRANLLRPQTSPQLPSRAARPHRTASKVDQSTSLGTSIRVGHDRTDRETVPRSRVNTAGQRAPMSPPCHRELRAAHRGLPPVTTSEKAAIRSRVWFDAATAHHSGWSPTSRDRAIAAAATVAFQPAVLDFHPAPSSGGHRTPDRSRASLPGDPFAQLDRATIDGRRRSATPRSQPRPGRAPLREPAQPFRVQPRPKLRSRAAASKPNIGQSRIPPSTSVSAREQASTDTIQ